MRQERKECKTWKMKKKKDDRGNEKTKGREGERRAEGAKN